MLFPAESWMDFYNVQGLAYKLPHLLISGNPPVPTARMLTFALASAAALLTSVSIFSWRVRDAERSGSLGGWRSVAARVVLVLGFFVLWETALHLFARNNPYLVYVPDPVTVWKMNPDMAEWARRNHLGIVGVNTHVEGILDTEIPFEKEAVARRLVFYGDSQLLSTSVEGSVMELTYPKALGRILQERHPDVVIEAVNSGCSGYTSWQGLMLLRNHGLRFRPDLVVLGFGYHDSNVTFTPDHLVLTDDPRVHRLRTLLYQSQAFLLLRKLVMMEKAVQEASSTRPARYRRVDQERYVRHLREAVELGKREGFRVALLQEPIRADAAGTVERTQAYREAARQLAEEEGLLLLDIFTSFAEMPREENLGLFTDEIHLNAAGHQRLAEIAAEQMAAAGYDP